MKSVWKILALLGRDSARTIDSLIQKGLFSLHDERQWNESECNRDKNGRFAEKSESSSDDPHEKQSKQDKHNEQDHEEHSRESQSVMGKKNKQEKSEFVEQQSGKKPTQKEQVIDALMADEPFINYADQQKHTDRQAASRASMKQFAQKQKEYQKRKAQNPQLQWVKPLPKSYYSRPQEDILKDIRDKISKKDYKVYKSGDNNDRLLVKLDKYSGMVYDKQEFNYRKTKCFEIVFSRKKGIHFYPVRQVKYDQQ